ncbi:aerobic-type carbon monoxide dehydrogenase small subunit (CoxS/CutS family) [Streptomyces sp. PvR006]|uniref:(2Fe-2S)-binding protein n=1 Tax=Streptomyces sp. PvR006 TaxID=2817860 RepID=UPI0027DD9F4E|nr:2Fe-2S iron-sulfur cluster-binding protein [Streptomyces sp. PvR006]MBP2582462.1 aerobic-type carbon monoxide dehydrogenase small subunit (CoxS/CutS family) [Streptomyces sp. PvR006]
MSNEQQRQQQNSGGWEPLPQSEGYDGDATAFVQLPPDFMLDGVPLEAPGHGYVPPMITPLQPLDPAAADPSATGTWNVHLPTQAEQTQYFDGTEYAEQVGYGEQGGYPAQGGYGDGQGGYGDGQGGYGDGRAGHAAGRAEYAEQFEQDPHATSEWRFTEVAEAPAPTGPGATGQWEIPGVSGVPGVSEPVEEAGSAEESGDFAASAVRPYAEAPATLPGGAPAPWAVREEPAAEPAAEPVAEAAADTAVTDAVTDVVAEAVTDAGEGHGASRAPDRATESAEEGAQARERDGEPDATDAPRTSDPSGREASEADTAPEPTTAIPATPAAAGAPTAPDAGLAASTDSDEHPHTSYTLRVNGADRPVTGSWIGESLLYVLRERLGLAGAKDGCSQGECGACNVQVDGRLVASCLVPAATAAGSEVRTVEGLAVDGEPSDVQRAMARCGTVQCGFCIPGMCMTVHDLLEGNHAPTELETRQALAGNLCRCSGYRGVLDAVKDVVSEREASAAAGAAEAAEEPRVPHQIPHPHDGGMA